MRLSTFLVLIAVGSVLSLFGWLVVFFAMSPTAVGWLGAWLFQLLAMGAAFGLFFFAGYGARRLFASGQILVDRLSVTARQAVFLTGLVGVWAVLQRFRMVRWWNLLLLVFIFAMAELFVVNHRQSNFNGRSDSTTPGAI